VFIQIAESILLVVSALFPIVDPIGGSPVFLSLTLNYDTKTRRLLARRIRRLTEHCDNLVGRPVSQRLAKQLLLLTEAHGIRTSADRVRIAIKMSQQELGQLVGTGMLSHRTAMETHPLIEDAQAEPREKEKLRYLIRVTYDGFCSRYWR